MSSHPRTERVTRPQGVSSALIRLAAPLVGLNLISVLALGVDTLMVSGLPEADAALAALGFAAQLYYLLQVALVGLSIGAASLLARAHGAGDPAEVSRLFSQARAMILLLGLVVGGLTVALAPMLLSALGASGESLELGLAYLRPLLWGLPVQGLALIQAAALRSVGNTWLPLVVGLVATGANVVLNLGLIGGRWGLPGLGVAGAAWGTLASQLITALALGWLITVGRVPGLRAPWARVRPDGRTWWALVRLGGPAALDMTVLNLGYLGVIGLLGAVEPMAVAAHAIGMRVLVLAFVPALAISQAVAALVGQHLGAGRDDLAARVVRVAAIHTLALMGIGLVSILASLDDIMALFAVAQGSTLAARVSEWLVIIALSLPILGLNILCVGLMQGAGITGTSLVINAGSTLLVQIPVGALLGWTMGLGPMGIWMSIPIGFGLRALLGGRVFWRGRWRGVGQDAGTSRRLIRPRWSSPQRSESQRAGLRPLQPDSPAPRAG